MSAPLVSAVIPVYNGEKYIETAIESVLAQTYRPIECIVVDDGSTDGTPERVGRFGDAVRYLRKRNGGVSSARNYGVAQSRGQLIAFLDADDAWLPEKTARQAALLASRPDVGLAYSGMFLADESLQPSHAVRPVAGRHALANSLTLTAPGVPLAQTGMVRRRAFDDAGGFDEQLSTSADLDFVCRVALRHPVEAVDEPLALYRLHPLQMHRNLDVMERDMLRIFEKIFTDPALPPELRRLSSRAHTKLYYSLALSHARRRDFRETARSALIALRRPDLVAAFFFAGVRRKLRLRPHAD